LALVYIYSETSKAIYHDIEDDVIILSPSMYWFKVCAIPTKNYSKAKKIALHMMSEKPSHFNEIELKRQEKDYHAYTYDKKSVKGIVKGLNLQNPKVYFANQLHLSEMVGVDKESFVYSFNERVMQASIGEHKPRLELTESYKELLEGEKPLSGFEKQTQKTNILSVSIVALFLLYIILFSIDKLQTISSIDEQLASMKTERSFYEIKSLIKKYKKLEKSSQKIKKDLTDALKKSDLKKVVIND